MIKQLSKSKQASPLKGGAKKDKLPLSVRVYECDNNECDWIADRDYSACLNLLGLAEPDVAVRRKRRFPPLRNAHQENACGEARADSL